MVIIMKLMSGASMRIYSIVAADVNNDGMVDIIIGNDGDGDGDGNQVLAMVNFMMQWNLYDGSICK